jgi:serine/threonine protein kinase
MRTSNPQPRRRSQKIQALFEAARELSPAQQASFLDRECADDFGIRLEIEGILAAARGPTDQRLKKLIDDDRTVADDHTVKARPARNEPESPADPAMLLPEPGTRIGQYELVRELGRGGMAVVYLARDVKLGRRVAIKFLQSNEAALTRRFVLEAQATARCVHENIVVIHDVKEYQANPFMVLEYLQGQTLSNHIKDGKVPPYRAVQLMVPVVRALVCAHEHKLVHRDLKPGNIILTNSGAIKVLDFGVAKYVHGELSHAHRDQLTGGGTTSLPWLAGAELTSHGALVGTMPFMSPEQWNAEPVDHRTDLWAVGIMLYIMVAGRHPLEPLGGNQLMVTAILDQPMPSARDAGVAMPPALADLIDHCLRKRKDERMPTAEKLLGDLERLMPDRHGRELSMGESPYAGLNAFQETDANRFFGRTREIAAMLGRLHERPLIGVVGPSGVGKSSFIRAGLIPTLKHSGEKWEAIVIRPGRHPTAALANIIAPMLTSESATLSDQVAQHQAILHRIYQEPGYVGTVLRSRSQSRMRKILLFVDQFEELFTLTPDLHERQVFMSSLAGMADDALSPLRVVLSIRSDFLDRVAEAPEFMAELSQSLFFLLPPNRDGLRDALTRPADMMRYRFETRGMVEHMLDTLETTPGSLPLLQFAASKLWDARDTERRLLTEQSYHALGGIVGALASHADAVINALPAPTQALARTILTQLVTPERTRAIASIEELCERAEAPAEVERLIHHLVDARLLVVQRSDSDAGVTVEIVHEALIHGWPTLGSWLEESQEDRAYLEQIRTAAKQWDSKGHPSGLLWRGEAADEARRWHRRYRGRLAPVQEAYLAAVIALSVRTARRKRLLVAGTISFLSLLVAAAAVALVQIRHAEQQTREQAMMARAAERRVRQQFDQLQEKERQRQEALRLAGDATTEAGMSAEQLLMVLDELRLTFADAEKTKQQLRQQLNAMQEKERQRKEALLLAADASAEAHMSAEQLRGVTGQLREALAESDAAKRQISKLLLEAEHVKSRLASSLVDAENARKQAEDARKQAETAKKQAETARKQAEDAQEEAERARDVERLRRERLEKEIGKPGAILR